MLEVKNICKTFRRGKPDEVKALRDISFRIETGTHLVVVGTNGSGKSALLNAIAGTIPVDNGRVFIGGKDVSSWNEYQRARLIGRVFQDPFTGTAPGMSIAENIALATRRGETRGLRRAVADHTLAEFKMRVKTLNMGLEDRLGNPVGSLSGGQRQALTLIMATCKKPELLLLDEHTAALDPKTAPLVMGLTEQLINRDKVTTLMVTHSMQQAVNLGSRLIVMHKGRIAYDFLADEKKRLRANDLLALFDEIRRKEQVDPALAEIIRERYV